MEVLCAEASDSAIGIGRKSIFGMVAKLVMWQMIAGRTIQCSEWRSASQCWATAHAASKLLQTAVFAAACKMPTMFFSIWESCRQSSIGAKSEMLDFSQDVAVRGGHFQSLHVENWNVSELREIAVFDAPLGFWCATHNSACNL